MNRGELSSSKDRMDETETTGPDPVCDDDPYPCYQSGIYEARCMRARVYLHPRLRAWKCELKYMLIPSGEIVFGFFNLGVGEKPMPTRGSNYRRAWIIASGEQPKKRQRLSHRMFVGKVFEVRIDVTTRTWDQREHVAAERYSTVKEILSRRWP
jgi:hypothetical protein